jgi:hypothetical protein
VFEETPHASGLAAGFFFRQWQGKLIAAASFLRTLPSQPRASLRSRESAQHGQAQFLGLLERDGEARVLLSTPARKYLQPRECFEKKGSPEPRSRDPYRAAGFVLIPTASS